MDYLRRKALQGSTYTNFALSRLKPAKYFTHGPRLSLDVDQKWLHLQTYFPSLVSTKYETSKLKISPQKVTYWKVSGITGRKKISMWPVKTSNPGHQSDILEGCRPRITPLSLFITLSPKLMANPRQIIFIS